MVLAVLVVGLSGCTPQPADASLPAASAQSTASASPTPPAAAANAGSHADAEAGTGTDAATDTDASTDPDAGRSSALDGADSSTPACQPASAATLAAVNATMTRPSYHPEGDPFTMLSLTAAPDPEHAVWLLVGTLPTGTSSDPHLVAWATTTDPTRDTFDGALRSLSGTTTQISSAPALLLPDLPGPGSLPAPALACAASPTRG
ncbi:hypothetical protein SCB71_00655 [Herbiconiux sp. KACC 21604]|uniref:hypothetical protein n=1 Tax=unclassified Herbiconiux TaxID=2618217 RepID=UPI001492B67B|nr:hypothetical protein [Herbiconiux sp. SALV-R1]QJU55584.1 hypothetical protein HL652_19510 [Herbiconiux sp. SALV-R1]WPO86779.1 hypothetical protein SCB71_00655 [Herbiconiux sp. KACC 21604]